MDALDPALLAGDPLDAADAARLEGQLVLLARLSEIGMTIAEAVAAEVTGRTAAPSVSPGGRLCKGDIVLAFTRVARAIRLTVALQFKLRGELQAWRRGEAPGAQAAEADDDAASEPEADPQEAFEAVEAVERIGRPESGSEREARDDIYAVLRRPTDEVIDLIRRDLGLSPEWVRQVQEEWARDHAASRRAELIPASPTAPPREQPVPGPMEPPERWPRPPPS